VLSFYQGEQTMLRVGLVCVATLILTCPAAATSGADDNQAESNRHPELVPFFAPLGNLDLPWPFANFSRPGEPTGQAAPEPLSPDEQRRLDDVLQAWERRSQSIARYRCTFKRWEYDTVFGPRDTFKTYSEGVIKYAAPDKGVFRVEKRLDWGPSEKPGDKPSFVLRQDRLEHWLCDGRWLYEHDPKNLRIIQRELPAQVRAPAAATYGVPFLVGAPVEIVRQRYWLRLLPVPDSVQGQYWLEAVPRLRPDAAKYKRLHVIIDQGDFLPRGLVIFDRNFDARTNPARTTYMFENVEVNWEDAQDAFGHEFDEPKLPDGWKKSVESAVLPRLSACGRVVCRGSLHKDNLACPTSVAAL
jgi:TIGR03009 family protein